MQLRLFRKYFKVAFKVTPVFIVSASKHQDHFSNNIADIQNVDSINDLSTDYSTAFLNSSLPKFSPICQSLECKWCFEARHSSSELTAFGRRECNLSLILMINAWIAASLLTCSGSSENSLFSSWSETKQTVFICSFNPQCLQSAHVKIPKSIPVYITVNTSTLPE